MDRSRQMLVFTLGCNQYAIDILHLVEVGRMPRLEETPGAPPLVLGIARLHGSPVRVYDLMRLLGEQAAPVPADDEVEIPRPWMVVSRCGDGARHWWVDTVHDIVDYDPRDVTDEDEDDDETTIPGVLEVNHRLTYLLTPDLLDRRELAWREQTPAAPVPPEPVQGEVAQADG